MPDPIEVRIDWVPVVTARHGERILDLATTLGEGDLRPLFATMKVAPTAGEAAVRAETVWVAADLGRYVSEDYAADIAAVLTAALKASLRG